MRHRIVAAMGLLLGTAGLASAEAEPKYTPTDRSWPGVCWGHVRNGFPSTSLIELPGEHEIGQFCLALRTGMAAFVGQGERVDRDKAYRDFEAAEAAAGAIPDPALRRLAYDEARVALAVTLEAQDQVGRALAIIRATGPTAALARGAMLARHEYFAEAVSVLESARHDRPGLWCDSLDQALVELRQSRDRPDQTSGLPELWQRQYLPSYLSPAQACADGKDWLSTTAPSGRSLHKLFPSGQSKVLDASALQQAALHIRMQIARFPDRQLIWVITGHADQECPRNPALDCKVSNMVLSIERARQVRLWLEAEFTARPPHRADGSVVAVSFRDLGRGMEDLLEPKAPGTPWAANRRVEIYPDEAAETAKPTAQCPWRVTLYPGDLAGRTVTGGAVQPTGIALTPGTVTEIDDQAGYTIQYEPGLVPAARYFYAISETDAHVQDNLIARSGLAGNDLSLLAPRQGFLTMNAMLRPDRGIRREVIGLYVAAGPVAELEGLTARLARRQPWVVSMEEIGTKEWHQGGSNAAVNPEIEWAPPDPAPIVAGASPQPVAQAPKPNPSPSPSPIVPVAAAPTPAPKPAPPVVAVTECRFILAVKPGHGG